MMCQRSPLRPHFDVSPAARAGSLVGDNEPHSLTDTSDYIRPRRPVRRRHPAEARQRRSFARRGVNPFCGLANSVYCQRRCSHTSSKSSVARSQEPGHHRPRGWRSSRPHGGIFGTRSRESGRHCAACGRASWARSQRWSNWVPSARPPSLVYRRRSVPWSSPKALTAVHPRGPKGSFPLRTGGHLNLLCRNLPAPE
jgi:hypothetical protein